MTARERYMRREIRAELARLGFERVVFGLARNLRHIRTVTARRDGYAVGVSFALVERPASVARRAAGYYA